MTSASQHSPTEGPRRFVRRKYLIDPTTQLSFGFLMVCMIVCASAGIAGLWVLSSKVAIEGDNDVTMDPAAAGNFVWMINIAYFVFSAVAMLLLTVRFTHRFIGPGRVIEQALAAMCERDYSARLTLRKGDRLKGVAAAAERLANRLREDEARLDALLSALGDSVARGDLEEVRAQLDAVTSRRKEVAAPVEELEPAEILA